MAPEGCALGCFTPCGTVPRGPCRRHLASAAAVISVTPAGKAVAPYDYRLHFLVTCEVHRPLPSKRVCLQPRGGSA